jgi:hypothetical protein
MLLLTPSGKVVSPSSEFLSSAAGTILADRSSQSQTRELYTNPLANCKADAQCATNPSIHVLEFKPYPPATPSNATPANDTRHASLADARKESYKTPAQKQVGDGLAPMVFVLTIHS